MKTARFSVLWLVIFTSAMAFSQEKVKTAADSRPSEAAFKPLTVLGQVSNDGKTLLTDLDTEWAVANAEALKGLEGKRVTVKCYVDSERARIRVLSAKSSEVKSASRLGDSAFRR